MKQLKYKPYRRYNPSQNAINLLHLKLDIVSVVSRFIVLKKTGIDYVGQCPLHLSDNPTFRLSTKLNKFKCFGCGISGNALTYLKLKYEIDSYTAFNYLYRNFDLKSKGVPYEIVDLKGRSYKGDSDDIDPF